eukprot:83180-Chlamydomonas_euryale.AAC.1
MPLRPWAGNPSDGLVGRTLGTLPEAAPPARRGVQGASASGAELPLAADANGVGLGDDDAWVSPFDDLGMSFSLLDTSFSQVDDPTFVSHLAGDGSKARAAAPTSAAPAGVLAARPEQPVRPAELVACGASATPSKALPELLLPHSATGGLHVGSAPPAQPNASAKLPPVLVERADIDGAAAASTPGSPTCRTYETTTTTTWMAI